jgi:cytochrome c biogenesis protein ResB
MNNLYNFLKSIKLAIVLILFITATSLLSTLIPQGKDLAFYYHNYPPFLNWLILTTKFNNFFRSFLFIVPTAVFFVNLLSCTIDRLSRELKKEAKRRFGPDILHIGLLILVIGSVITFTGRKEGFMNLSEGDQVKLPGGYILTLESFDFLTYENGRPKDWISTVHVEKDDKIIVESFGIEVNKPLKIGNLDLYQNSYSIDYLVTLKNRAGNSITLNRGETFDLLDTTLRYLGNETGENGKNSAVIEEWQNRKLLKVHSLGIDETVGDLTIASMKTNSITGIEAVTDPGFIPVLIGLLCLGAGMILTYYQKLGDKAI